MKTKFAILAFLFLAVISVPHAFPVSATTAVTPNAPIVSIDLPNPLALDGCNGKSDLECFVDRVVKMLIIIAFPVATLMIIWGAFLLMTSQGNVEKIEKGWATIRYTIFGFMILLLATLIVAVVQGVFTSITTGDTSSIGGGGNPPPAAAACSDEAPTGSCPAGESCLFTAGHYGCRGVGDL